MVNVDKWVGNCKVHMSDWVDGSHIYLHIEEFTYGQSISSNPIWERSFLFSKSDEGILCDRLDSVVRGLSNRMYEKKELEGMT